LADLAGESNDENPGLWTRGLLIRRRMADGDLAFFTTWCPAATSIETLVELIRWSIQEVRRVAIRLARKRIQPAHIIAWSLWRRAHQAAAERAHLKPKRQP
jgi:hypothetical protein